MAIQEPPEPRVRETQFETRRGVGRISVEHGYAQVHLSQMPETALADSRLAVLKGVAEAFVNVRFPKFTPSGASFLVEERDVVRVETVLRSAGGRFSLRSGRSVVSVHAPSIREEAGLIARLVAAFAESGVPVEHVADAHDRLMAVVRTESAGRLADALGPFVDRRSRPVEPRRRERRRRIRVMKFGGTSVATPEAREAAARKVAQAVAAGFRPVVVVSAIGRDGLPYATDTLIGQARAANPGREPDPRDLDLMMACGEILSAVIFAGALGTAGIPAHAFRGDQAGIRTDGAFGRARIVGVRPARLEESLREGYVPVVCGFQGGVGPREGAPCGEVTTLGRGGSDTTAAALGAALGADAVEIYTDVDGILSADPRAVPFARTLWTTTYEEVASLAHLGAKVVHPRAAEIAMAYGVPLWVKNTFSDERGTEIVADERCTSRRRTGVTSLGEIVYLRFDLGSIPPEARSERTGRAFRRLAEGGVAVLMVDLSPTSAGLAVPKAVYALVERLLDELDVPVSIVRPGALVSLVGQEYVRTPGSLRAGLVALRKAGVEAIQTNAVDLAIGFLVPERDAKAAVHALFEVHASMDDD